MVVVTTAPELFAKMPATNAVDTIEDLIALLDRHPQWLEALRSRILTL